MKEPSINYHKGFSKFEHVYFYDTNLFSEVYFCIFHMCLKVPATYTKLIEIDQHHEQVGPELPNKLSSIKITSTKFLLGETCVNFS